MKEKSSRSKFLWFPSRLSSALPYIPLICNSCTTDFCSSKVAPKTFCQLWKNKTVLETIKNKKNVKWQSEKPAIAFALCCLLTEILRLHLRSGKHRKFLMSFPPVPFLFSSFLVYIEVGKKAPVFFQNTGYALVDWDLFFWTLKNKIKRFPKRHVPT